MNSALWRIKDISSKKISGSYEFLEVQKENRVAGITENLIFYIMRKHHKIQNIK